MSRFKASGSGGSTSGSKSEKFEKKDGGSEEYTGLRSLLYSMSKDAKTSSDHLLLKDEGM